MSNIKLSVIIPAYNESVNLKNGALSQVWEYLKGVEYPYEVLIVDDGSKDNTVSVARQQVKTMRGFQVVENPHGGKALTVISGMQKASGEIVVFTDMDQATPINQIEKLFPQFIEGHDIVIGSRHGRRGAPLIRKISAWGFATLRNILLGLPFADTQCGFKAFNQKAVSEVFPKMEDIWREKVSSGAAVNAGFDVEMLFLAKQRGLKIVEVPVEWHYVGTERVQLVKDAYEAIKDMIRIRLNQLSGKYN